MTVKITLACTECKQRNYNTTKNKKNNPDRLEILPFLQEAHRSSRNQVKERRTHYGRQNREKAGLCGQS